VKLPHVRKAFHTALLKMAATTRRDPR